MPTSTYSCVEEESDIQVYTCDQTGSRCSSGLPFWPFWKLLARIKIVHLHFFIWKEITRIKHFLKNLSLLFLFGPNNF